MVADRLHVRVRQPPLRFARTQQNTGESEPFDPVIIDHETELSRRRLNEIFRSAT